MNKKIAISGTSGLMGSRLTTTFQQQGHSVYRLVRQKPGEGALDVYWNYESGEIDSVRLEQMDAVIHLAGKALSGNLHICCTC